MRFLSSLSSAFTAKVPCRDIKHCTYISDKPFSMITTDTIPWTNEQGTSQRRIGGSRPNSEEPSVSETWLWHCLSCVYVCVNQRGPRNLLLCGEVHLWWHYTESKHGAVVCGSGHFPQHGRLHKDHRTTLLFTVWPADELLSVVRLWSTSTVKQKGHLCWGIVPCNWQNLFYKHTL